MNENALEGMECPSCHSDGDFRISVRAWALVADEGVVTTDTYSWNDDSLIECRDCTYHGKVSDFRIS